VLVCSSFLPVRAALTLWKITMGLMIYSGSFSEML